jgi:hypothetical protein
MSNLDYYLLEDHAARRRTTLVGAAVGAALGIVLQGLGLSLNVTALVCFAAAGVVEITGVITYRQVIRKARTPAPVMSFRRELLQGALSAAAILILALLRIPRLEAAIWERKLIQATAGLPPYDKANEIVQSAIESDVAIGLKSVDTARLQIFPHLTAANPPVGPPPAVTLSPAQEKGSANFTSVQLDVYTIYRLTGVKLNPLLRALILSGIYSVDATLHVNWGPIIGLSRAHSGLREVDFKNTYGNSVFQYEGGEDRDAYVAHLTAASVRSGSPVTPPAFIQRDNSSSRLAVFDVSLSDLAQTLDDIIWADVTFDRCYITYRGGPLQIKDVTFRNCDFIADNESAQAVLEQIKLQGEKPVTIWHP